MDLHLDRLLNLPDVTVESCIQFAPEVILKLRFLQEESNCRYCQRPSAQLNQNRPVLIRDLSIFGQPVYLKVPRRQFYCRTCQKYFTESLNFVDWERRYTQRYENHIYQRVQATTIEQVSREENLSWDQVQGICNHRFDRSKKQTGERLLV